jgi:hypothetical protein
VVRQILNTIAILQHLIMAAIPRAGYIMYSAYPISRGGQHAEIKLEDSELYMVIKKFYQKVHDFGVEQLDLVPTETGELNSSG